MPLWRVTIRETWTRYLHWNAIESIDSRDVEIAPVATAKAKISYRRLNLENTYTDAQS